MRKTGQHVICLVVMMICTSCVHVPKLTDYRFHGRELSQAEHELLESHLLEEQKKFKSLRLFSRCVFTYADEHYDFRYAFVARAPHDLRIEQFPLTGFYSLSALVSTPAGTTVVFQSEQRALEAATGKEGLQSLFGTSIPLTESDIGLLLAGVLPHALRGKESQVRLQVEPEGAYLLRSPTLFALVGKDYQLRQLHLFDQETQSELLSLKLEYDQQSVPKRFLLDIATERVALECGALQRSRDHEVRNDLFKLEIPSDFSVQRDLTR